MTRGTDGSATVWSLIVVLVIWAAAAVASLEAASVQVRHRAAAAADAAALAAAAEGGLDPATACAAARVAAGRVGARVRTCAMTGPYAVVSVTMSPPTPLGWAGTVAARARAGPADTGAAGQADTGAAGQADSGGAGQADSGGAGQSATTRAAS